MTVGLLSFVTWRLTATRLSKGRMLVTINNVTVASTDGSPLDAR